MAMTLITIGIGYLLGSIPFALLLARRHGIELRNVGSRNPGAANVLRAAGVGPAVVVMLLDAAKGTVAVTAARLISDDLAVVTSAGVAAIVGHIYPVWCGFRGGKGVAASAGVFAVLAPLATAIAALVFVGTIAATRFISAGSIAGALALPVAAAVGHVPHSVEAGTLLAAAIVIVRHRDNVSRLMAGTERRIGLRL
jgi:acyl phosphate:glycerol-3-phosphate acyltransferase